MNTYIQVLLKAFPETKLLKESKKKMRGLLTS